jgi:glycosyltransferase involved in cell wall biosynthesis
MSNSESSTVTYSVIIPVGRRVDPLDRLVAEYDEALNRTGAAYEIIVVLDGPSEHRKQCLGVLRGLRETCDRLRILELAREFGESSALAAGFDAANGEWLITLPAYYQIDPTEVIELCSMATEANDMLIAVRSRRGASFDNFRRWAFHALFKVTSGMQFRDLGCGVRLMKREVVTEIPLYGEQHRFFPALARQRGFRVEEIELVQSAKDQVGGRYGLREHLRRLLDIISAFFLLRFTRKPLRFFGTIGFLSASVGSIFTLVLVVQRLLYGMPLANRPALILASLLIVLGVQIFALGLIGELIIFTHASKMKEYAIRRVTKNRLADEPDSRIDAAGSDEP